MQSQPAEAKLIEYSLGGDTPETWGRFHLKVDDLLEVWVSLSSSKLRELAIETLAQQGPYLNYTPANQSMREPVYYQGRYGQDKEPRWKHRNAVENLRNHLEELREQKGDAIFFSALQGLE